MSDSFNIDANGAWNGNVESKHYYDNNLSIFLIDLLRKHNIQYILDLGCGIGKYAKNFYDNGISCDCYDGHPNTRSITNNLCSTLDLSKLVSLNKKYDCVISLEVGEHIPKSFEDNFIQNIVTHSNNFIIMSWAIPGQPGDGHVNCQTNEYIIKRIEKNNFYYNPQTTLLLRKQASLWWFKNTLMFFQKTKPS